MRAALLSLAVAAALILPACEDGPFAPPGQFVCGTEFCETSTHFCAHSPGAPQGFLCGLLPDACKGVPSCDCVMSTCTGDCQVDDDGSVTLTCS
jgi:hypothetical protein